jgi:calmodulin
MSTFSTAKTEEFRHVFELFDKNGDGSIDANEIGQVMRSLGLNPTNKEVADLIAEVDKNGNQRLDFQEFVAFMSKHWHERDQEAELREAFRLFDRDNSGYITINELKQVMLNMGEKLNQEELEDMMREADVNRDGKLDYQEFVQKLLSTS